MARGKVVQIVGPVIDCRFNENEIPRINDAVRILVGGDTKESDKDVFAEVLQQRGNGVVRCVSFNATEGLMRGLVAESLGSSVKVPVGENITGRLFDALGRTIDNGGPLEPEDRWEIHRPAPSFTDQYPSAHF